MTECNGTVDAGRAEQDRQISVGEWFLLMLFMSVPILGLIIAAVGAFSEWGSGTLRNYFRAGLIWWGIAIVVWGVWLLARL